MPESAVVRKLRRNGQLYQYVGRIKEQEVFRLMESGQCYVYSRGRQLTHSVELTAIANRGRPQFLQQKREEEFVNPS